MSMNRHLSSEQMRCFDNGTCFVLEHLRSKPQPCPAGYAAGRGKLDHVSATTDLTADRTPTIVRTIADIAIALDRFMQLVPKAKRWVHVPGCDGKRRSGIDDSRP